MKDLVMTNDGPREATYRETANLSFAAYLSMNRMKIIKASESRGRGNVEYLFSFHDPDNRWNDLTIQYANSESARFDNAVRTLKQLCKRKMSDW